MTTTTASQASPGNSTDKDLQAMQLALETLSQVPEQFVMGDHPVFGMLRAAIKRRTQAGSTVPAAA